MNVNLLSCALRWAAIWHEGQYRKAWEPRVPYIAHPALVGSLVARAGGSDEAIAAAYVHDVIEDCGVSSEELTRLVSADVAEIVGAVTESKQLPWMARKAQYRESVRNGPVDAYWVAWADHVANVSDYAELAQRGDGSLERAFPNSRWDIRIAHERALADVLRTTLPEEMMRELDDVIDRLAHVLQVSLQAMR